MGMNIESKPSRANAGWSEGVLFLQVINIDASPSQVLLHGLIHRRFIYPQVLINLSIGMAHQVDAFVFHLPSALGSPWPPLKMTAKCYRPLNMSSLEDGLTVLFFHCIGAHKEQWELVVTYLFNQKLPAPGQNKIREAWSFDWPSHGDAAILNRKLLEDRKDRVSVYDWVPGVTQFIRSGHVQGHKLILCGHSAGAGTAVHAVAEFYPDLASVGITGLILVEPHLITRELFNTQFKAQMALMENRMSSVLSRKDCWKSRQDALLYFQQQRPWSNWDPEVIQSLVSYGLYERDDGIVALKCDKKQEAKSFPDVDPQLDGILRLNKLCHALSIHLIWGVQSGHQLMVKLMQDSLSDPAAGRPMVSITRVKRCGHMILQERPFELARAIYNVLGTIPSGSPATVRSKL